MPALERHFQDRDLRGILALGVVEHPDGRFTAALLSAEGALHLEPLSRSGGLLKAQLKGRDGRLEAWHSSAEGVQQLPLKVDALGRFELNTLGLAPGNLEILSRQRRLRHPLALFPLKPQAQRYPDPGQPPKERPTLQAQRASLLAALAALRAKIGRPPLKLNERLSAPLRAWLERMATRNAQGMPKGLLDKRGWPFARLRFGFTHGQDGRQAAQLLWESPTGRALLESQEGELALALRLFPRAVGFDAVLIRAEALEPLPPEEARAQLRGIIQTQRQAAGLSPVRGLPELDLLCQELAEDLLAGRGSWEQASAQLKTLIKEQGFIYGAFKVGALSRRELKNARFKALGATMRWLGLGVAAGPLPGQGNPRYLILYVLAEHHKGEQKRASEGS